MEPITIGLIILTIASALGLTGCADSDLENANLRIENTKMCMEIAEKAGFQVYPAVNEAVFFIYSSTLKDCLAIFVLDEVVMATNFSNREVILDEPFPKNDQEKDRFTKNLLEVGVSNVNIKAILNRKK